MRIVYLHQYFNTPAMSGGTRSYEMAKRLVANGHEVHMVTSWREEGKEGWSVSMEDGIHVHWLAVPYSNKMGFAKRLLAFFKFSFLSMRKAASLNADIIFATSTPLTIALPGIYAARKGKIPFVFEVRDLWPEIPVAIGALNNPILIFCAKKLERWSYKNSRAVVALSPGMKKGVVAGGVSADQVAVIPNSADNDLFVVDNVKVSEFRASRAWLGDRPLLIYAGTFGKVNGVGYLVNLAKLVLEIDPNVRFLLVGDGAEKTTVLRDAKASGVLNTNLFIEPPCSKNDMAVLFGAASITSSVCIDLPELRHNSANKFFDSLAAAKPIFLNYGGWQNELIQKNDCGICAWQKDEDAVAKELVAKLRDAEWLANAGRRAKILGVDYFDRDVLARQLNDVLEVAARNGNQSVDKIAPGVY